MRSVALVSALVLVGCDSGGDPMAPTHAPTFVSLAFPAEPQLDVLVVMDNSSEMLRGAVTALGSAMPAFFAAIETDGMLPDLHFGVVTSDLATLGVNIGDPACAMSDRGHLQNVDCPEVTGGYVADITDGMGGRMTNYTGTLASAVSCLLDVGQGGCGYEQHLEAMKVAIDDTDTFNSGFFRPTAQLAVLIMADDDDCSPDDPAFFGPESAALGPLDRFRCFEFGVTCAEADPRAIGPRTACAPRSNSFLHEIQRYLDVLDAERPGRYSIHTITGTPEPVDVAAGTPSGNTVSPSCMRAGDGSARPGIRLASFAGATADFGSSSSICEADFAGALTAFGDRVHDRMRGQPCLRGEAWDSDPMVDGLQPACTAVLTEQQAPPVDLLPCDATASNPPCWRLVADPACGAAPADLRIDAVGVTQSLGRHVQAHCEILE
jgi:hypothetical protein